ncbi:MAG: hypothetical protein ACI83W_002108, partial [Marinoscillum sp.]
HLKNLKWTIHGKYLRKYWMTLQKQSNLKNYFINQ